MNKFLHITFCAIWLSLLSNHSIAQSEEGDLDCLEFELLEKDENGYQVPHSYLTEQYIKEFPDSNPAEYLRRTDLYYAEVDLNDDNQPEGFFISPRRYFCGMDTCSIQSVQILEDGSLGRISRGITITSSRVSNYVDDHSFGGAICVLDNETEDWKDIATHEGRGGLVFTNGFYEKI